MKIEDEALKKENRILLGILLVLMAGILYIITAGSKAIREEERACELTGGVQVKVYSGFACIQNGRKT